MSVKTALAKVGKFLIKESPAIALGFGIVGSALTIYETIKVTKKVTKIIENEEEDLERPLETKEKAIIILKTAWPVMIMGACTAGCYIFSYASAKKKIDFAQKQVGLLSSGLHMANAELKAHQDALVEAVGKEKADEVHKKFVREQAQKKLDRVPDDDIPTPLLDNEYIFFEPYTGTPFISTFDEVTNAMRYVNDTRDSDPFSGPTPFRTFLYSLPTLKDACDADIGVLLGWNTKKDIKDRVELIVEDTVRTAKGPAWLIEYDPQPTWIGYDY